jgi:hypothetical protein
MKRTPLYAALDLHSRYSVLGSMDHEGKAQGRARFATTGQMLERYVQGLRRKKRPIYLTMEAGAMSRWASTIVRPLVTSHLRAAPQPADQFQSYQE